MCQRQAMCQVRRLAFPFFRAASGMPSVAPLMAVAASPARFQIHHSVQPLR
jgi:hypothetical protein